jgi:hypothetical protein
MATANRYLREVYQPPFNQEFGHAATESGSGFSRLIGRDVKAFDTSSMERTVDNDICL